MERELTVKTVVKDLYDLTVATSITDTDTGEQINLRDFQDLAYQQVEQLADLLGIDLDEA